MKTAPTDPPKPTWLLDVDGVLNSFAKPGWSSAPWQRKITVLRHWSPEALDKAGDFGAFLKRNGITETPEEYRLRWAPALMTRIRRLLTAGNVDVVWCTTWCPDAGLLEDLWRFPPLERVWTEHLHGYHAVEAKRAAALAVLAGGGRLIWTDDDAFPKRGPFIDPIVGTGRALLIKPDQRSGLQRPDMDAIEAFIDGTLDASVTSSVLLPAVRERSSAGQAPS